jgi:hypothetical protein
VPRGFKEHVTPTYLLQIFDYVQVWVRHVLYKIMKSTIILYSRRREGARTNSMCVAEQLICNGSIFFHNRQRVPVLVRRDEKERRITTRRLEKELSDYLCFVANRSIAYVLLQNEALLMFC